MAYNVQKAREAGVSDDKIVAYLQKTGRAPDEIKALMGGHGETYAGISHYAKPALQLGGMTAGQGIGGALGLGTSEITGPAGPMFGRVMGGTAGNVVGGMGGDALRSLMGTQDPSQILSNVPDEAKEGAALSGVGEAVGLGLKGAGLIKNLISKDAGVAKGLSDVAEGLTGQSGSEFRKLYRNPRAWLPRWAGGYPGKGRAWESFVGAAENEGVPKAYHEWTGVKTPEISDFITETMDKIKRGAKVTKQEAVSLLSAVREVAGSDEPRMYKYYDQAKNKALEIIKKEMPKTAEAYSNYAKSRLGSGFRSSGFGLLSKIPDTDKAAGYRLFYEMRRLAPILAGGATGAATHSLPLGIGIGLMGSPQAVGAIPAAAGAATKFLESPRSVTAALKAYREMTNSQ